MNNKIVLSVKNLNKIYNKNIQALKNLNLDVNEGEIFGMLGPNGVGKSTIFNLITGLISPNNGKILITNQNVTNFPIYLRTKKFKVGYVPQWWIF